MTIFFLYSHWQIAQGIFLDKTLYSLREKSREVNIRLGAANVYVNIYFLRQRYDVGLRPYAIFRFSSFFLCLFYFSDFFGMKN